GAGRLLEHEEDGDRLAADAQGAEGAEHLLDERADLRRAPLRQPERREVERDERLVVGETVLGESGARLEERELGLLRLAQTGGNPAFEPAETQAVEQRAVPAVEVAVCTDELAAGKELAVVDLRPDEIMDSSEEHRRSALGIEKLNSVLQQSDRLRQIASGAD